MDPHNSPTIVVTENPRAVQISFDRPPVNAFTPEMLQYLDRVLCDLSVNPRPLLLNGTRQVFSAGFDIKLPATETEAADSLSRQLIARLGEYPAPVIAAVEGAAIGLGLLLATSADLLVISRTAVLRMPEISLGLDADPTPLQRFLPASWVRRMCLTGEPFTPLDLHLSATGVAVCDEGAAFAVARAALDELELLDPAALQRAKAAMTSAST